MALAGSKSGASRDSPGKGSCSERRWDGGRTTLVEGVYDEPAREADRCGAAPMGNNERDGPAMAFGVTTGALAAFDSGVAGMRVADRTADFADLSNEATTLGPGAGPWSLKPLH